MALRMREAGLRAVVAREGLTIRRRRRGRGFEYRHETGGKVTRPATLKRLRSLAIPPAYAEVRIAAHADHHIQAVGRDAAGRLQYIYHPQWEELREEKKSSRLAALCRALPRIRRRLRRLLDRANLDREKAMAAVLCLLDSTHIRIGCENYVHSGRSRGAATLLKRNVRCEGQQVTLTFRGKGGKDIECSLRLPELVAVLGQLREVPGPRLFQYVDAKGQRRQIRSHEVNAFLRAVADCPVSAKDFRTLAATVAAAEKLFKMGPAHSKTDERQQVSTVMREVAQILANTPAVTRKSYVHPRVLEAHAEGELQNLFRKHRATRHLSRGEAVVAALFR